MTSPQIVGGITLSATITAAGIVDDTRNAVAAAMLAGQNRANQNPIRVPVDTSNMGILVGIGVANAMRDGQRAADANPIDIPVRLDFSNVPASLQAQVQNITTLFDLELPVDVRPDFSNFPQAVTTGLAQIQHLFNWELVVPVNLDSGAAVAQYQALLAQLNAQGGVTVDVDVDTDRANRGLLTLGGSLRGIAGTAGGIAGVTAAIAAIGGAAGAAGGLVGGLLVGLTALGPAAAAIGATLAVGLSGVGDAFTAMNAVADAAPKEAEAQAKAVASAQKTLVSSTRAVTDAEKSLGRAQRDRLDLEDDLSDARKTAIQQLEDYDLAVRGASISEAEAADDLAEAQAALLDPAIALDADAKKDALRDLEKAQLRYDETMVRGRRLREEATDAEQKGIENSDAVTGVREQMAAADERVSDAADRLTQAQSAAADAATALAQAQSAGLPSVEKMDQALAKLAPNARDWVLAAGDLKGTFNDLVGDPVQSALFAGSADGLREMADSLLPLVGEGLTGIATELNLSAHGFADFLTSAKGVEGLNAVFGGTTNLLAGMRAATDGFAAGMVDLVTTAEPHLFDIGKAFGQIGTEIGGAFTAAAESGELNRAFDGFATLLEGIGPLVGDLVGALITLSAEVLPSLGPLFATLGDTVSHIAGPLGSLGAVFADSLSDILPSLGDLIVALANGLQPVLPVVADLMESLFRAAIPLIEPFSQIAVIVGTALADAVLAIAPSLPALADAFVALLQAVAPLVPLIAENFSTVLLALAPALSEIFLALGPVISQFADQMGPVLEQVAPILAEVAGTIGTALADALRQIAPVLPELVGGFTNLLLSVLPILPELANLAVSVLPPLVDILVKLTPAIVLVTDVLAWLISEVVIPLVIPSVQLMVEQFTTGFEQMGNVADIISQSLTGAFDIIVIGVEGIGVAWDATVSWVTDTILPALESGVGEVERFISNAVAAISSTWDSLRGALAKPINFMIGTVYNDGIAKAWNTVAQFLPGLQPAIPLPLIPEHYTGGRINGPAGRDNVLMWGTRDEHMLTVSDVVKAGGHNIVFALRDMIQRGIPFTWDNGRIISELGRNNLERYGAAVAVKGIGNVPPEGLFDQLLPQFYAGGPITGDQPWMAQLARGHEFARAQSGKPYQWAGPRFVGDSFDCSGFMGSIAAVILGLDEWRRYWATSSFAGYPAVGPQGFTKNLADAGFVIGVTDDPGGPGGGHTAGVLGAVGLFPTARVESGGDLGNVHYGAGPDPRSFAALYGLPIGANGFFDPGPGGLAGYSGPSVADQRSYLDRRVTEAFDLVLNPIKGGIAAAIGSPPPAWLAIPPTFLDTGRDFLVDGALGIVAGLGNAIGAVWSKALSAGENVLDFLNPFDSGGVATGTGFLPKNVLAPERVLSPEQTSLFEVLVASLQSLAAGAGAVGSGAPLEVTLAPESVRAIGSTLAPEETLPSGQSTAGFLARTAGNIDETGQVLSDTRALLERTETSTQAVAEEQHRQVMAALGNIAVQLTDTVLVPALEAGLSAAFSSAQADQAFNTLGRQVGQVAGDILSRAVQVAFASKGGGIGFAAGGVLPGYTPGRDVHAFWSPTAGSLYLSGGEGIAVPELVTALGGPAAFDALNAAARGGRGGPAGRGHFATGGRTSTPNMGGGIGDVLVAAILQVVGVEVEILDFVIGISKDVRAFRGEIATFTATTGEILSDTSALIQRTETSRETEMAERDRIMREIMKGVLKYIVTTILIPIIGAVLSTLITLATTAIGAAIAGPIGAVIGAAVGAGLGGLATLLTAGLTGLLTAGIDAAFDSGGMATGIGLMPKNIVAPERVLSPRQTQDFGRLVDILDGRGGSTRTIQIGSVNNYGNDPAGRTADRLLDLLHTS